jgi:hypothetical protein
MEIVLHTIANADVNGQFIVVLHSSLRRTIVRGERHNNIMFRVLQPQSKSTQLFRFSYFGFKFIQNFAIHRYVFFLSLQVLPRSTKDKNTHLPT